MCEPLTREQLIEKLATETMRADQECARANKLRIALGIAIQDTYWPNSKPDSLRLCTDVYTETARA